MRSIFGWSYPPGCSGPPEAPDPSPQSEAMYTLLEAAGVEESIIEQACAIVDALVDDLARGCEQCERLALEAEAKAAKEAEEYWASLSVAEEEEAGT